ncbi:uncharacterized protein BX663DRAFT_426290 [Cokeromyces recurvatus]|uniref:uncharacterized protein n=1 Tax=Cokeromyces recurvatus TaxID=90255 RepID=UPI002220EEDE|nr:uncharacterized protein BX663DRAFT_426290 [Cokeromyces recurvatus]KAI7906953.1 hypothetical protein BX663DRAFT_426290 [Cokeromyces recurvatus]
MYFLLLYLIRTDGFVVDFLFYKRCQASYGPSLQRFELTLRDFTLPEVAKDYHPIFVDPGRKSVFTAVSGLNESRHPIIRCSTKEYYHLTGSTVFSAQQQFLKSQNGIEDIESRIPTTKTSNPERFLDYVQYLFDNINTLFNFYNSSTAKKRFQLYQGRQKAQETMVNMLINGDTKYNRSRRNKKRQKKKKQKKKRKKKPNKNDTIKYKYFLLEYIQTVINSIFFL